MIEITRVWKAIAPAVRRAPALGAVREGLLLARRLRFALQHPLRPDEWGLVLPMNLGDTYVMCALVESLRAVHGGSSVTAFVVPRQRYIPTLFGAIDHVVVVPTTRMLWGVAWTARRPGIPARAHHSRVLRDLLGYKGLTLTDVNRAWLSLPMDASLAAPRRPSAGEEARAAAIFDAHGLPPGRTVVLAPDSNTAHEYPLAAWAALAEALRAAGWHPVTNGGPEGTVIPGTARLDVPLELVVAVAERAGRVVTMRTGLADVLSSARCRLTVLYPPAPEGLVGPEFRDDGRPHAVDWYAAFSLVRMGLSATAEEHVVDDAGFTALIPQLAGRAHAPA